MAQRWENRDPVPAQLRLDQQRCDRVGDQQLPVGRQVSVEPTCWPGCGAAFASAIKLAGASASGETTKRLPARVSASMRHKTTSFRLPAKH